MGAHRQKQSNIPDGMQVALRAMGFPVKKAEVHELLRRHGEEENDKLDFETFKKACSGEQCDGDGQAGARMLLWLWGESTIVPRSQLGPATHLG